MKLEKPRSKDPEYERQVKELGRKAEEWNAKIFTFEEFTGGEANNFHLHFGPNSMYETFRKNAKKFWKEYPELADLLDKRVPIIYEEQGFEAVYKSLGKELYQAYRIMRDYGFNNQDLLA